MKWVIAAVILAGYIGYRWAVAHARHVERDQAEAAECSFADLHDPLKRNGGTS